MQTGGYGVMTLELHMVLQHVRRTCLCHHPQLPSMCLETWGLCVVMHRQHAMAHRSVGSKFMACPSLCQMSQYDQTEKLLRKPQS